MPSPNLPFYEPGEVWKPIAADHIAYFATFNADRFRGKIESWLPELNLNGVHLVIGDNCSTDTSMIWLPKLAQELGLDHSVIRNRKNFGGYGAFAVNLNRFPETRWFTMLHQDDKYLSNHVQEHRNVLKASPPNLGMICSEYATVSLDGKTIPYPRAYWLLNESSDLATVFLANLRNHAYPFSGATFSMEIFNKFPIPWHSSAFPDTELVLKMCAEYKVVFAKGLTVEYLENPASESHVLTSAQREFGAFQALIRVFAHKNFALVCKSVSTKNRDQFIDSLIEGISLRFENKQLRMLMIQMALEHTVEPLGYFAHQARHLAQAYYSIHDNRAVDVLIAVGGFPKSELTDEWKVEVTSESRALPVFRTKLWSSVVNCFPIRFRKSLFRLMMRSNYVKSKLRAWDFDWITD